MIQGGTASCTLVLIDDMLAVQHAPEPISTGTIIQGFGTKASTASVKTS